MMQFMFLLEDSSENNGCTVVVPKSHKSKLYKQKNKKIKKVNWESWRCYNWDSRLGWNLRE